MRRAFIGVLMVTIIILALCGDVRGRKRTKAVQRKRPKQGTAQAPSRVNQRSVNVTTPHSGQRVRLRGDSSNYYEGLLEVYRGGRWGVVCDDDWDISDANVACKQLGFRLGAVHAFSKAHFGTGKWTNEDILMDDVDCKGYEALLLECPYSSSHNCKVAEAASVQCRQNTGCEKGWIAGPTGCYQFHNRMVKSAKKAKNICSKAGGNLAHIETESENNFLSNTLSQLYRNTNRHVWLLGGRRKKSVWFWETEPPRKKKPRKPKKPKKGKKPKRKSGKRSKRNNQAKSRRYPKRSGRHRRATRITEMEYTNWFPGWIPTQFAIEPYLSSGVFCLSLTNIYRHPNGTMQNVDYFFWDAIRCKIKQKTLNIICEKPRNETKRKTSRRQRDCYEGNGEDYRGTAAMTDQGTPCLNWASAAQINPGTYPGKGLGDHNYCRNPDNSLRPWCWVTSDPQYYGHCGLPSCSDVSPDTDISEAKECYEGDGRDYRGSISVTRIGTACQKWTLSSSINPQTHPHLGLGDHNLCRNPDESVKPWCWVDVENTKFGYCEIPECLANGTSPTSPSVNQGIQQTIECPGGQHFCRLGLVEGLSTTVSLQMCIPESYHCDGENDCLEGSDEENCNYKLPLFTKTENRVFGAERIEGYRNTPLELCAKLCVGSNGFVCRSFCYRREKRECFLTAENSNTAGDLLETSPAYDFYELSSQLSGCQDMFQCDNGKCIDLNLVCNGHDDCDDFSDEDTDCGEHSTEDAELEVRLAGGDSEHSGRVEIKYRGEWGVICDELWDINDAHVVCRMLGYQNGAQREAVKSEFGYGNAVFMLDDVQCSGEETSIANCKKSRWKHHNCKKYQVAGVECVSGKGTVCESGEFRCPKENKCITALAVCNNVNDCVDGFDELDCVPRLSLADGTNSSGRVEMTLNGVLGTICDDEWDEKDATVACRMLGFQYGGITVGNKFGAGKGMIWLDNTKCTGNERSLADCGDVIWGKHNCGHSEDVGVSCLTDPPTKSTTVSPEIAMRIELEGGRDGSEGRIHIWLDEVNGTVCDDNFDNNDATVVCRMLGYQGGRTSNNVLYGGGGSGLILIDEVGCTGDEESLALCEYHTIHDCSHSEDAAVRCYNDQQETMRIELEGGRDGSEGRIHIWLDGVNGTVCDDNFDNNDATVVCRMLGYQGGNTANNAIYGGGGDGMIIMDEVGCDGNEESLALCHYRTTHDCSHSEDVAVRCYSNHEETDGISVRLVGGEEDFIGRVFVEIDGILGTVCDDKFGVEEANVICRSLGHQSGTKIATENFHINGLNEFDILLDELKCIGNESNIFDCNSDGLGVHDCTHAEDAAVECHNTNHMTTRIPVTTPTSATQPQDVVRLIGGTGPEEGRLQVQHNGVNGTVCDDGFEEAEATVVCRTLGYVRGIKVDTDYFGRGEGPILLDDVNCQGSESSIFDCERSNWGTHNCNHEEDVGIICSSDQREPTTTPTPVSVELVGGSTADRGRVEIIRDRVRGTVCDDRWGNEDALVICKMLGYIDGRATVGGHFEKGQGKIWLDEVMCTGEENNINECDHAEWGVNDCSHTEDAGAYCLNYKFPVIDVNDVQVSIEPVNGNEQRGFVFLHSGGSSGRLCTHSERWGVEEATVACKSLGFNSGRPTVLESQQSDSDWSYRFECEGGEANLIGCTITEEPETYHCPTGQYAGVVCGMEPLTTTPVHTTRRPSSGFHIELVNGNSPNEGRVEIVWDGERGTVCDDSWSNEDADVVCRMLGYERGGIAETDQSFGVGDRDLRIFFDDVECEGGETSLLDCPRAYETDCNHLEDAGVVCITGKGYDRIFSNCGARPIIDVVNARKKRETNDDSIYGPPKVLAEYPRLEKIIGGRNAAYGYYPWQVGVRLSRYFGDEEKQHWCGGTIISEYWVLSAAHCFDGRSKSDYRLRVGDLNNKKEEDYEEEFEVEELVMHDKYNDGVQYDNDVALLKVKPINGRGIQFGTYVQPACLPMSTTKYTSGKNCLISGWGQTTIGSPDMLKKADVPLIQRTTCTTFYRYGLTSQMFCAGIKEGGVDTCQGDSGGPLVCEDEGKFTVLGVTSWGNGCGQPDAPGVYAHVRNLLPWIQKTLKANGK